MLNDDLHVAVPHFSDGSKHLLEDRAFADVGNYCFLFH